MKKALNLQTHVFIIVVLASTSSISATLIPPISKPGCADSCGGVSIPFPFGTSKECSHSEVFFLTCNSTHFNPPKLFLPGSAIEITDISLDGQLRILNFVAHDCYNLSGARISYSDPTVFLSTSLTINNTANKFTIVGCDTYGFVYGRRLDRDYQTGCTAMCYGEDDVEKGSCSGLGCCQTSIPKQVWKAVIELKSYGNYSKVFDFNNCGYAFLAEEGAFSFSPENITNLRNVEKLPMVVDWAIGNGSCEAAKMNSSSYACTSLDSDCYKPNNGYGYRCSCRSGYQGNPYLDAGCQDIDECEDPNLSKCEKRCVNTQGSFECVCPKGYHGDGRSDGQGCIRGESLLFKLVAGISLGIIVVLLSTWWIYLVIQKRRLTKMRQQFFHQNGGQMLQQQLKREGSPQTATIFSESELIKATNNFHRSMIVGQGGYGVVYKGVLPNNCLVAIKKSKEFDPNQIQQFANEFIVLSQINHRNVVRLLGCCLETQVPLLVYEFINNGTLFEHIHNKPKARRLSWDTRLRIAAEAAGVLSHLHSGVSTPIIHRDVKSANILLDHTLSAKVSDFGASRLFPMDQTQVNTLVQGTFGYLDPEYMLTSQLTEKSDVYSFGVVLVELLTGIKALCYDKPEEERCLANFFLSVMKQDSLFQILDENVERGEREEVMRVAILARNCLKVRGDERPFMREVEMELEGLRLLRTQLHRSNSSQITEFDSFEDTNTSFGFDSLKDQVVSPMGGGR
ncbi:wall-associated receptor kinase 2-like [Salvia miltiorrhiza]|uniref:wall-associated receptor kinase 2-like n=1 Tax=Salvia miltiorrhiza TaxID=226208 RepID=UPI0025AC199C|nr:wall-associated receptor kinase 2-like [Salvia miltiorrhiza]